MYFLQSSWRLPWSRIVTASDASPTGYAVCIGKWPQQKVAQHGRVLERSRFKRNPGSSARDSFKQANDFVKGADGLWHPRVEADQPEVNSVWSQVTAFPEVELRPPKTRLACCHQSELEIRRRYPVVRGTRSFSWFAGDGVCGIC